MYTANTPRHRSRTALVLAGGGISGAMYEIGALRAIDDLLRHLTVNDFDMYVGTSAGSLVSASLASGVTPRELMRIVEGALPDAGPLQRNQILAPNIRGVMKRRRYWPRLVRHTLTNLRNPRSFMSLDWLWEMLEGLPSGLYSTQNLELYLRRFLADRGNNAFRSLQRELYIVATELDSGERAVFGADKLRDVPVSQAVAASSAMPIIFEPVRINDIDYIDGGVRGTASLDVAIDRGAKLIVCINPLVAFDNRDQKLGGHIADAGIQAIGNQVFRTFIQAGLHYHIKKLRQQHPDVDIILIEPSSTDDLVFSEHVMSYASRLRLARYGYESATLHLADEYVYYKAILARHGIPISRRRVIAELARMLEHDSPETVKQLITGSLDRQHPLTRASKSWRTAHLANVLHDLEDSLEELNSPR